MNKLIFMLCLFALATGCDSNEPVCTKQVSADKINAVDQTQLQNDIITIDDYLASKSIVAVEDPTGLARAAQGRG